MQYTLLSWVWLALTIAHRQLRQSYGQNFLGFFWIAATPLVYALLFVFIKAGMTQSSFQIDTNGLHPGIFAFVGIAFFQMFFAALLAQADSVRSNKTFLANNIIPSHLVTLIQMLVTLPGLAIRLLLILLLCWLLTNAPVTAYATIVTCGIAAWMIGNALGNILVPFATFFPDVSVFLRSISLGLILMSPVFYPPFDDPDSAIYIINIINPLVAPIDTARAAITSEASNLRELLVAWFICVMLCSAFILRINKRIFPIL